MEQVQAEHIYRDSISCLRGTWRVPTD